MKSCWKMVVAALLGWGGSASAEVLSGPVTNPANGHTYYLLSRQPWTSAEVEAVSLGGHLATINDLAENEWVAAQFRQPFGAMWIGLNDAAVEGTYVWVSGDPSPYRNWYGGTPAVSQPDADYIAIRFDRFNQWIPYPNGSATFGTDVGVAEVIPEPGATWFLVVAASRLLRRTRRARFCVAHARSSRQTPVRCSMADVGGRLTCA